MMGGSVSKGPRARRPCNGRTPIRRAMPMMRSMSSMGSSEAMGASMRRPTAPVQRPAAGAPGRRLARWPRCLGAPTRRRCGRGRGRQPPGRCRLGGAERECGGHGPTVRHGGCSAAAAPIRAVRRGTVKPQRGCRFVSRALLTMSGSAAVRGRSDHRSRDREHLTGASASLRGTAAARSEADVQQIASSCSSRRAARCSAWLTSASRCDIARSSAVIESRHR